MRMGGARLVGRDAELAALEAALADSVRGAFRAVVVSGEAGIGKSRLVRDFAERSASRALVVTGQAADSGSGPVPFAAIAAVLRELRVSIGADERLDGARESLARLDEVVERREHEGDGEVLEAFHRAISRLLEDVARLRPLVVVLEDLHWADGGSLAFIRHLFGTVRGVPLLLVMTYRDDDVARHHPLRGLLMELDRARSVERVGLRRLDESGVAALAEAILGHRLDPVELGSVVERTEGVPFYVEEVVCCLDEELPTSLRDILLYRYAQLDASTQAVLRAVAAGGTAVRHSLLSAVVDLAERDLDAAVRQAVEAQILIVEDDGYRFRHALMREAVYGELLPGERLRLHTGYATALSTRKPTAAVLAEIANHWWMARVPDRALETAVAAQGAALRAWAPSTAAQLGERALELWEQVDDPATIAGVPRHELLRRTANALRDDGLVVRALEFAREAAEAWPADDRAGYAAALGEVAEILSETGGPGSLELLERALALLEPGEADSARARLLLEKARTLMLLGRFAEAIAVATDAHDTGMRAERPVVASHALSIRGVCRVQVVDRGGLEDLERARVLADGDFPALMRYHVNASESHLAVEDYESALRIAEEGLARSREYGGPISSTYVGANVVEALMYLGRWERALDLIDDIADRIGPSIFKVWIQERLLWILIWSGRLGEAEAIVRANRALFDRTIKVDIQSRGPITSDIALLALHRGDIDEALAVIGYLVDGERSAFMRNELPLLWTAARVLAAARASRAVDVEPYRATLERYRASPSHPLWSALFAAELGEAPWEPILDMHGPAHIRPYARMRLGARVLADGDRASARGHLALAIEEAARIGAGLIVDEASALLADAGLSPKASDHLLTPREEQVLALIAEGLTNAQIASRLFISVKTVSIHVSAILRKLGVSSRTEAAVRAVR